MTKKKLEQAIRGFIEDTKGEYSAAEQKLFATEIENYQGNYPHILFQFLANLYPARLNEKHAKVMNQHAEVMNRLTTILVIVAVVQAGVAILQTVVTLLSILIP